MYVLAFVEPTLHSWENCHLNIVCESSSRGKGMLCGCNSCWDDILDMPGKIEMWQRMTDGLDLRKYRKLSGGLGRGSPQAGLSTF